MAFVTAAVTQEYVTQQ